MKRMIVSSSIMTSDLMDILPDPIVRNAEYEPGKDDLYVDSSYDVVLEVLKTQGGYAIIDEGGSYSSREAYLTRGPISISLTEYNNCDGCFIKLC